MTRTGTSPGTARWKPASQSNWSQQTHHVCEIRIIQFNIMKRILSKFFRAKRSNSAFLLLSRILIISIDNYVLAAGRGEKKKKKKQRKDCLCFVKGKPGRIYLVFIHYTEWNLKVQEKMSHSLCTGLLQWQESISYQNEGNTEDGVNINWALSTPWEKSW